MEEYKKIANVTKKIDPDAPHDVILVLTQPLAKMLSIKLKSLTKLYLLLV